MEGDEKQSPNRFVLLTDFRTHTHTHVYTLSHIHTHLNNRQKLKTNSPSFSFIHWLLRCIGKRFLFVGGTKG